MGRNVGSIDKVIRLVIGAILVAAGLFALGGTTGIIAAIIGAVLIVTGLINFCPLFKILGISSFRGSAN
jgi:uncharacterized membrane protein